MKISFTATVKEESLIQPPLLLCNLSNAREETFLWVKFLCKAPWEGGSSKSTLWGCAARARAVLSHRCLSHPKCDSMFSLITWVMEQGQYLLSGQLSDIREGLQLPQRIDLVFNMILSSLKEILEKKLKTFC